jgi:lysophospholipase L1-like esterase
MPRPMLAAAGAALLLLTGVAHPMAAGSPAPSPAPTWYLALGDSIAAGWQPIGRPEDDHVTDMGYPDQLWLMARTWVPDLQLVKLGCPGESTASISQASTRCSYAHGSQLAEAVAFLEAHPGQVAFITIDTGFSDFPCDTGVACVAPGIESISEHLPGVLGALRDAAPDVPIAGMTIYDPFLPAWLTGDEATAQLSLVVVGSINSTLSRIYADAGARVADVAGAFETGDIATMVPLAGHGLVPRDVAVVCAWTWLCVPPPLGPDRHPNVLGQRAIADAFAAQLRP